MNLIPSRFDRAGLTMFASEALSNFNSIAAIAPSSPYLAEAMVAPLPLDAAQVAVEFGPGTGVMTTGLLNALPRNARLFAFEINPKFVSYLRSEIADPRLTVIAGGAETAAEELAKHGIFKVDAVLSSLGLSLLPPEVSDRIFSNLVPLMRPDTVFTQFQYVLRTHFECCRPIYFDIERGLLSRYFSSIERGWVLRNLPPAFVYQCRV